jgi:hypothetical protein
MTKSRKSHVVIAVAAASLAGAGAAVAESSHTGSATLSHGLRAGGPAGMHDDLSVAATYLGLAESELQAKLRSGKTMAAVANATDGKSAGGLVDALVEAARTNIESDVSSGRLTQSQADGILSSLEQHITARVNSTGPPGGPHARGGAHGGLDAAAAYLGLSDSALQTQLQSGKTLGEIADAAAGKSKAGLIEALVTDEKSQLAQAVKDGHLTQSQADDLALNIDTKFTDLVNGKLPQRPDGFPPGGGGPPPA